MVVDILNVFINYCKNSVHAHLCTPFAFQIGKKWCLSWWAWTCDMQWKVLSSEEKEWPATAEPSVAVTTPSSSCQM